MMYCISCEQSKQSSMRPITSHTKSLLKASTNAAARGCGSAGNKHANFANYRTLAERAAHINPDAMNTKEHCLSGSLRQSATQWQQKHTFPAGSCVSASTEGARAVSRIKHSDYCKRAEGTTCTGQGKVGSFTLERWLPAPA